MYYNYHNRLKQLLESEDYICVEETGNLHIDLYSQS